MTRDKVYEAKQLQEREDVAWILQKHRDANHFYDTYLPYEFHLRMVVNVFKQFSYLYKTEICGAVYDADAVCLACLAHDTIEDARVSYNDLKEQFGHAVADIVYAVTNEKGHNRKERANETYYEGIRNTPGATFVKLCDRIANVQYGKLTKSRMFDMYKKENQAFLVSVRASQYPEMKEYLCNLFKEDI